MEKRSGYLVLGLSEILVPVETNKEENIEKQFGICIKECDGDEDVQGGKITRIFK